MSMQTTDPIADLLTRIRNAKLVGKTEVRVPSSKMKKVIAEQLVKTATWQMSNWKMLNLVACW